MTHIDPNQKGTSETGSVITAKTMHANIAEELPIDSSEVAETLAALQGFAAAMKANCNEMLYLMDKFKEE